MNAYRYSRACALLLATTLVIPASAAPRGRTGFFPVIPGNPGQYELKDTAEVIKAEMDWSKLVQKQDQEAYEKASKEAEAAYQELYGACASQDAKTCTGLMQLRQIHIETVISKSKVIPAGELSMAVSNFKRTRDLLQQKLAAISVIQEVWKGLGAQVGPESTSKRDQALLVYQKGQLNLKAVADVYLEGINKMVAEATGLTYRVDDNSSVITTQAGMGLDENMTTETPESLAQQLEVFTKRAALTDQDKKDLSSVPIEIGRHMAEFTNTNDLRLVWMNKLQKEDKSDWVESLEKKARIVKYLKALYCMPMGVPALDVPEPKKLNIDYLIRGVKSRIRIVQKSETDETAIRKTLSRFDQVFVSAESQGGKYDDVGGVMGIINRVNSTLTWHNEIEAYLSIMNILRDMFQDEVDLSDPVAGCEKVRNRYYAKFVTMKDPTFQKTVEILTSGVTASSDPAQKAFAIAGKVINTKGKYTRDKQLFMAKHPGASLIGQAVDQDPDLK